MQLTGTASTEQEAQSFKLVLGAHRRTTDSDTIRILVSTDNHVGFAERDPIRKDDSWRTFDEVMTLAKERDVDMVLLAGDLFHENSKFLTGSIDDEANRKQNRHASPCTR